MSYFSEEETRGLDPRLVAALERARGYALAPFVITEGLAVGGSHVSDSAHQRGLAVDIRCTGSQSRMRIVTGLLMVGFKRVGVYDLHIHADIDTSLPQDVMWVGKSK